MLQKITMVNALYYNIQKCIYNYLKKFMVSWWGTDSYFNNELIKIDDFEMMTTAFSSLE